MVLLQDNGTAERSNEEIARYNAYVEQYKKQLAAQGQLGGKPAATGTKQEDGKGKVADPAEATDAVPSGAVKRPRSGEADEQLGHGAGEHRTLAACTIHSLHVVRLLAVATRYTLFASILQHCSCHRRYCSMRHHMTTICHFVLCGSVGSLQIA